MLNTKTNFVDEKVEIDPKDLQVSFDNNTTEIKDTENKETKPNVVKVSLGNDSEALAEEKSKPKEKQDKDKIKQLKKSIKNRQKEIKDQVKNNKKYKPNTNAWNGVIDDENADDWSYVANNWPWANIPQYGDFKEAAATAINKDTTNASKDREYYLNLTQRGFEEWNGMQENPDDPNNYKKWEEENQKWKDNAKEKLAKYTGAFLLKPYLTKGEIDEINPERIKLGYKNAVEAGDYDAAVILRQAYINAKENAKENEKKSTKKEKIYRVSPSKNGNYYVVESSYDDGKTWHFVDSSTDLEEANKKMEYLEKGLTTSGLTQEEAKAKASIPEDTSTNDNADQNSETESTKKENKNNVITLTQYEIDHPNFTESIKKILKPGGNFSIGNAIGAINTGINTGITNGATPKKSSYWTNFLYGNDKGSVQNDKEAKAEKEKKMNDFLKNNPNLVKAIFGKNSGLNFGERVARLGEMLAMIGADAAKGAYAGFNHQAFPEATKGSYSEIYNNALKNQYERKQDVFKSENKANIDKANRISILKSSPILSKLDDDMLSQLADKIVTGITEAEWDNYENA